MRGRGRRGRGDKPLLLAGPRRLRLGGFAVAARHCGGIREGRLRCSERGCRGLLPLPLPCCCRSSPLSTSGHSSRSGSEVVAPPLPLYGGIAWPGRHPPGVRQLLLLLLGLHCLALGDPSAPRYRRRPQSAWLLDRACASRGVRRWGDAAMRFCCRSVEPASRLRPCWCQAPQMRATPCPMSSGVQTSFIARWPQTHHPKCRLTLFLLLRQAAYADTMHRCSSGQLRKLALPACPRPAFEIRRAERALVKWRMLIYAPAN